MATDFTYGGKQIVSGGPFKPGGKDMPSDARTRVDCYADIATIPNPYVGLKITVKVDETNNNKMTDYIVKSLKANSIGLANSLIDEVVRYVDYLGVSSNSGNVSQEDIKTAVNNYFEENPVQSGATTEQAAQIQANKTAIGDTNSGLIKEVNDIKNTELEKLNTAIQTLDETVGNKNGLPSGDANIIASINRIDNKETGGSLTAEQIELLNTVKNKATSLVVENNKIQLKNIEGNLIGESATLPSSVSGNVSELSDLSNINKISTQSNNLYDVNKVTFGGYYHFNSGEWMSNSTSVSTDFIPVIPGETYVRNINEYTNISYYDSNYNIVFGAGETTTSTSIVIPSTINIAYTRLSLTKDNYKTFLYSKNTIASDNFREDVYIIDKDKISLSKGIFPANKRCGKIPLFIETPYEGGNQLTHPKIISIPQSFNGYKYWMAYTPFGWGAEPVENPCIACSNDLYRWVTPEGLNNPIAPEPSNGYNSDSHLLYNENNNTLECWYRGALQDAGQKYEVIYRKTSTDGINWSEAEILKQTAPGSGYLKLLCPTVFIEDGVYHIWTAENDVGNLRKWNSVDGTNWVDEGLCKALKDNGSEVTLSGVWHHDVIKTNKGYELVFATTGLNRNIKYCYGSTKTSFGYPTMLLSTSKTKGDIDSYGYYRPTLLKENGIYYVIYGVLNNDLGDANISWKISMSVSDYENIHSIRGIGYTDELKMAPHTFRPRFGDYIGQMEFDTTLNKPVWCKAAGKNTIWIDAYGNEVANSNENEETVINVNSVSIDKTECSVKVGENITLTANVNPSNATNKEVTWSKNSNNVNISNNGLTCTITGVLEGTSVITVTTTDGGYRATATVTVTSQSTGSETIALTGISLNKNSSVLTVGDKETLNVTFTPSNATNRNILWSASNSNATVVNGLVTAVSEGDCRITAKSSENSNIQAYCDYTINSKTITPVSTSFIPYSITPTDKASYEEIENGYRLFTTSNAGYQTVDFKIAKENIVPDKRYFIKYTAEVISGKSKLYITSGSKSVANNGSNAISEGNTETKTLYFNTPFEINDEGLKFSFHITESTSSGEIRLTNLELINLETHVVESYTPEPTSLFVPTSATFTPYVGTEILADNSIHVFTTANGSTQSITVSINNIESGSNYTLQYDLELLASSGAYCIIGKLANNMDNIRRDVGKYNGETLTFTANNTTLTITFVVTGASELTGDILVKNIMLTKN